jgi:hypothetical protein
MFKTLSAKQRQLEEEPEKTLDLLDELLFTIHSTRANVLEARAKKYEKRVAKRKEKAKMAMRRANRGTFIDERDRDEEIDELFQDVAQDFQARAPGTKQKGGSSSSDSYEDNAEETMKAVNSLSIGGGASPTAADRMRKSMEFMNDVLDNDIDQKDQKKKTDKKARAAKLLQGAPDTYGGREELQNDFNAATIFEEFRNELTKWFKSNPAARNDVDQKGTYADYLNDKYLCEKLDPLPPSITISNVRKNISNIVEKLASSGMLSADWPEKTFAKLMPEQEPDHLKPTKVDKKVALENMEKRSEMIEDKVYPGRRQAEAERKQKEEEAAEAERRMAYEAAGTTPPKKGVRFDDGKGGKEEDPGEKRKSNQEKAADERERIKRQYEMYKSKKAVLEDANVKSSKAVQDSEALQDDIRSLLSTIQNGK